MPCPFKREKIMANKLLDSDKLPILPFVPNKRTLFKDSFRRICGESLIARIENALKEGRTELDLYRPIGSCKANLNTETLLEHLRQAGLVVTPKPSYNLNCNLYVISNLGVL